MNPLKIALLLISLCFIYNIRAQLTIEEITKIDSLKNVIKTAKHDTIIVNAWKEWDNIILEVDPNLDFILIQKIDSLSNLNLNKELDSTTKDYFLKTRSTALNDLGSICYGQSKYKEAINYFIQSLKIDEDLQDTSGIGSTLNNIGVIYFMEGDYSNALNFYQRSLKIREDLNEKKGIAATLNNIGSIYNEQGNYSKAMDYNTQSLKIKEEIGDKKSIASSLNNIGDIYHSQGDYIKAMDYYTHSLKIREEIGDKKGIAISFDNMGAIYEDNGQYYKSIDYHSQSLKIREQLGDKKGVANSLNSIGFAYAFLGDYIKAIDFYQQSIKIEEEIGTKLSAANALNNLSYVYMNQADNARREGGEKFASERFALALNYSERSLALAQELGVVFETRNALRSLLRIHTLMGSVSYAKTYLTALMSLIENSVETNYFTLSELEKQGYFATLEKDYRRYYDFTNSFKSEFPNLKDTAYNITLKNKGLALKSSTAMRHAIHKSGDSVLIKDYENWLILKQEISKQFESGKETNELENKANEIEKELVKKSTFFSDFDKVKNLKWQDVQLGLKQNEAAIEFVHFSSEIDTTKSVIYVAFIIRKDSQHPEMVQLCTEKELKEILGTIQGNNLSFVNKVYGTKTKAQKALYEKIWQPLEIHLQGVQNIYYSPSGLLHKVSFAAISKGDNVFLCDNYQLHQQSSTGKVALPSNVMYDAKDAYLLMGGVQYNTDKTKKEIWNYLPGTLNETDNIQSFLEKKKHSVNLYAANDANETNFKTQAQKANVLHISTHGFFFPDPEQVREEVKKNEVKEENIIFRGTEALDSTERSSALYANWSFVINKNPLMRSGLVLAGANDVWQRNALEEGEDGILTAQEVSNLDLRNTKLVVLSACETGLGDIKGSEGVFGLQRAFKMAGAEFLIMSLWQVPDKETAEFMELFYKNLVKVKEIPKAFNLTQQAMRKKYDPYYWGAFILIE